MTHSDHFISRPASTFRPVARIWIVTLAAGLTAASITWLAAESLMVDETGTGTKGGHARVSPVVHITRNGMTSLAFLGGTLGLCLGLAGGLLHRSARSAILASTVGALLGTGAAAGGARLLVPIYFQPSTSSDMLLPLLIHAALWLPVALIAGLAFGLGVGGGRRVKEAIIYAVVAAMLATVLYEFGGVWLFPNAQTERPLPASSAGRLFGDLVVALTISSALAYAASRSLRSFTGPDSTQP